MPIFGLSTTKFWVKALPIPNVMLHVIMREEEFVGNKSLKNQQKNQCDSTTVDCNLIWGLRVRWTRRTYVFTLAA